LIYGLHKNGQPVRITDGMPEGFPNRDFRLPISLHDREPMGFLEITSDLYVCDAHLNYI
jgi:hypothetical protein